jgi:hypothetical protein
MYFDTEVLKSKECFKRYNRVFIISHLKHTPFAIEGCELHRMTYGYESQVGNPTLIGLDLPLTTLVGIAGRRNILTYIHAYKNNKSKSLSDYTQ